MRETMNERRVRTKKLALSSCIVALGVTLMYFGAILNFLDLTMIAITSLAVFFAVIEMGSYYPIMIYAATSVLSLLLLPDKFSAVVYLAFGGLYPIIKEKLERIKGPVCTVLKFICFNISLAVVMTVSVLILFPKADDGWLYYAAVVLLANAAFFIYDIAMTRLITLYVKKIRIRMKMDRFFK